MVAQEEVEKKIQDQGVDKQNSPSTPTQIKESLLDEGSKSSSPIPTKKGKKVKRQIYKGQAHIKSSYNNTIVSISDLNGGLLGWSSAGVLGFKGAKKSTPYAATQIVADVVEKVKKNQVKELDVFVKGLGNGREAAIRALANNGFEIVSIKDVTPVPHNGCRPRRPRRI